MTRRGVRRLSPSNLPITFVTLPRRKLPSIVYSGAQGRETLRRKCVVC